MTSDNKLIRDVFACIKISTEYDLFYKKRPGLATNNVLSPFFEKIM